MLFGRVDTFPISILNFKEKQKGKDCLIPGIDYLSSI